LPDCGPDRSICSVAVERRDDRKTAVTAGPLGFRPMSHPTFTEVIICLVPRPTPARPGQTISWSPPG